MADAPTPASPRRWTRTAWFAGAAVIGAVIASLLFGPKNRQNPPIAQVLPARETVGFVAVESPDLWLQAFDRATASLTADERRALDALLSPQRRTAIVGFDPASALGWQQIGVDPERGIAVSLDARRFDALQTAQLWVAGGPPRTPTAKALKWQMPARQTPRELQWSVASLGASELAAAATQDEASPRLDRDPVLQAAFADMPTGVRAAFYTHADGLLAALKPHLDARKLAGLQHVAQRLRGASLVITPQRTAGRLVLSGDGIESLRQIFGNAAPRQPFTRFLPHTGVLALRLTLNLPEIFDGLMTWLPPQWLDARLGLASGRLGLLATAGLDWTQLERALAGPVVLALDLSAPATADAPPVWLGLLAVRDAAVTDTALGQWAQRSTQRGVAVVAQAVAGHAGWLARETGFVAVRIEDTLLLAPSVAAAERALRQDAPLAPRDELDGDVVLGVVLQPPPEISGGRSPADGWRRALSALEPLALGLRRDPHGLRLEASAMPLSGLLHLAAWFLRAPPVSA